MPALPKPASGNTKFQLHHLLLLIGLVLLFSIPIGLMLFSKEREKKQPVPPVHRQQSAPKAAG